MNLSVQSLRDSVCRVFGLSGDHKSSAKPSFDKSAVMLPQHALLAITYNCVAACPHCYLLQQDASVFNGKRMMDEELFMQIVNSPSFKEVSKVTFAGGEALLHPFLFSWIDEVKNRGINDIATITNGLLLQRGKVVDNLMATTALTHFNVSLDSDNKDEYCKVKGIQSCDFDGILKSVEKLTAHFKNTRTRVSGSFVRYTVSAGDVRRILLFGQSLGFHKMTIHALHVASDSGSTGSNDADIFKGISDEIVSHADYDVDVTVKVPVSVAEKTFYCPSLAKYLCVGADGMMAPCCHIPWGAAYGSFDTKSKNAINNPAIMDMRGKFISAAQGADDALLPEPCRQCPKRARKNLIFKASSKSWSRS